MKMREPILIQKVLGINDVIRSRIEFLTAARQVTINIVDDSNKDTNDDSVSVLNSTAKRDNFVIFYQ